MNKLEEILQEYIDPHSNLFDSLYKRQINGYEQVTLAMKNYAECYAHKCLEIAAKEAVTNIPLHPQLHMTKNVHKGSITGIKLPDHE